MRVARKKKLQSKSSAKRSAGVSKKDPSRVAASQKRQSIAIVGAGRLGTALAFALAGKGYVIDSVVSRRLSQARCLAKSIGPRTLVLSSAHLSRLPPADIIFITTPDDSIESVATQLASVIKPTGKVRVALHASGALSSEVLSSLREAGFHTGSMHPLVSISEPTAGSNSFEGVSFCIEGEAKAVQVARSLVRSLGGQSFSIRARDKALYHAAAVMSSGHLVALFDVAVEMLKHCNLSERQARAALLPLIQSTLDNLARQSTARALTGSFARADLATIGRHLAALHDLGDRDVTAAYVLLGKRSLELAKKNGASEQSLKKIKRILEGIYETDWHGQQP